MSAKVWFVWDWTSAFTTVVHWHEGRHAHRVARLLWFLLVLSHFCAAWCWSCGVLVQKIGLMIFNVENRTVWLIICLISSKFLKLLARHCSKLRLEHRWDSPWPCKPHSFLLQVLRLTSPLCERFHSFCCWVLCKCCRVGMWFRDFLKKKGMLWTLTHHSVLFLEVVMLSLENLSKKWPRFHFLPCTN